MLRIFIICCLVTIITQESAGANKYGFRYVESFSSVNSGMEKTQVWDIEQGDNDFMFFATNDGLGVYDGVRWENYNKKYPMIIRSLYYSRESDTLYSGSVNEFGKWVKDEYGFFQYTPLFKNNDSQITYEFWRTGQPEGSDKVYFQSIHTIFQYNLSNGEFNTVNSQKAYKYMHITGKDIFVQDGDMLYRMNEELESKPLMEIFDRVIRIEDNSNGLFYLFLEHQGVYTLDSLGVFKELNEETNKILSKSKLFSEKKFDDEKFLIGTTLSGMFEINLLGEIVTPINEKAALNSTTVLSLNIDSSNDIWLGLDSGIARIDVSSGESYLLDESRLGTIQAIMQFEDQVFLGSNKGLFVVKENNAILVDEIPGPVWDLLIIDKKLYITHDLGVFQWENNKPILLKEGGSTSITQSKKSNIYVCGDYQGLSFFKLEKEGLVYNGKIKNYIGSSRHIMFDKYGFLWIVIDRVGFTRLTFSEDYSTVTETKHFKISEDEQLPRLSIVKVDNEPVFYWNNTAYSYDVTIDKMIFNEYATSLVQKIGENITRLVQKGNLFLYQTPEDIGIALRKGKNITKTTGLFNKIYNKRITNSFTSFDDSTFAIGFHNGVGFYKMRPQIKKKLSIRKIEAIGVGAPIYHDFRNSQFSLPYNKRYLRIYPSNLNSNNLINYRILGADTAWQTAVLKDYVEITDLLQGDYVLQLKNADQDEVESVSIHLNINRPWYFSTTLIIIYVLIVLFIYLVIRHFLIKKTKEKAMKVAERERIAQKEQIEKLEKENLKIEIREKDKRLATITMVGLQKKGLLTSLRESFKRIYDLADYTNYKDNITKIIKLLDKQLENNEEWELLEEYYNNIYDGLLDRLKTEYPMLTVADMKLCVYIKLKLNNKEIADLLNISPRSVEMSKYRLRKKLDLEPYDDFSSILS